MKFRTFDQIYLLESNEMKYLFKCEYIFSDCIFYECCYKIIMISTSELLFDIE